MARMTTVRTKAMMARMTSEDGEDNRKEDNDVKDDDIEEDGDNGEDDR